jgi:sRNA-binding protein
MDWPAASSSSAALCATGAVLDGQAVGEVSEAEREMARARLVKIQRARRARREARAKKQAAAEAVKPAKAAKKAAETKAPTARKILTLKKKG